MLQTSFLIWSKVSGIGSLILIRFKDANESISSSKGYTDNTQHDLAVEMCKTPVLYIPNQQLIISKELGDYI